MIAETSRPSPIRPIPMNTTDTVLDALDWAQTELSDSPENASVTVTRLNECLCLVREVLPAGQWTELIEECRQHPVCALLHQDPFTHRAFTRPAGDHCDAGLLDIVYNRDWRGVSRERPTELGESIFRHTIESQMPAAVRHRRGMLAAMIDDIGWRRPHAAMLAVACGHLRELPLSTAMRAGRVGRFVGLDQDGTNLALAAEQWPEGVVETVQGSFKALWSAPLSEERFDFIYTAGLCDYLNESLARRLTARLFDMLRPGGRLLLANCQPGIADVGYMEAFMDWRLIQRDRVDMERLAASLPESEVADERTFTDPGDAMIYLQLTRRW